MAPGGTAAPVAAPVPVRRRSMRPGHQAPGPARPVRPGPRPAGAWRWPRSGPRARRRRPDSGPPTRAQRWTQASDGRWQDRISSEVAGQWVTARGCRQKPRWFRSNAILLDSGLYTPLAFVRFGSRLQGWRAMARGVVTRGRWPAAAGGCTAAPVLAPTPVRARTIPRVIPSGS